MHFGILCCYVAYVNDVSIIGDSFLPPPSTQFKPRFGWNTGFQPAGGQDVRAPSIHSWTYPKGKAHQ